MRARRGAAPSEGHVVWFVDRSLGRGVAEALRAVGEDVVHHDDEFPQDALDEEWLPVCGERGWVVLTKDKAIRRRMQERQAHLAAGGRAFFLTSGSMTGVDMAQVFVAHLGRMRRLVSTQPPPFIALVDRGGVKVHIASPKPRGVKRGRR